LDEAIDLARHLQARIQLVHVIEPIVVMPAEAMAGAVVALTEGVRSAGAELLRDCEKKAAEAGVEVETELMETLAGSAGEYIVNKAQESNSDLIVCGTHGRRGLRRMLMGSDAEYIVRRSPVPVLLVRQQEQAAEAA
jgi:nucleotide-binding universal stress UspA family protein